MKKIVVISDNHGDQEVLNYIKSKENDADLFIHLGDSETDDESVLEGMYCVTGNNDWEIDLPKALIIEVENIRFFVTHGQNFGYFNKEEMMYAVLEENDCDVLLSGHTHMPEYKEFKDKIFINPGSTSWPRGGSLPSYAVLIVDHNSLKCEHIAI